MPKLPVFTKTSPKETDPLQHVEQRVLHLEALVQEMQLEIEQLRRAVHPQNQRRLEKMRTYQQQLDEMFGLSRHNNPLIPPL